MIETGSYAVGTSESKLVERWVRTTEGHGEIMRNDPALDFEEA